MSDLRNLDGNGVSVSVITPTYNSAKFIGETVRSVQKQTLPNWEMIIVDDGSTDNTVQLVRQFTQVDKRIKLIQLGNNFGPSIARQRALKIARGRYIAFLDSDDLWSENKLELQIEFMSLNNCAFSCTAYEHIDSHGRSKGRIITPPFRADYNRVLLDCPIGNSTVIYDTKILGKCYGPCVRNREDYGLWLKILKKEKNVYGLNRVLTKYRIRAKSLSRNKIKLVYYHWVLYRDFEHLSVIRSLFHIGYWIFIKIFRLK